MAAITATRTTNADGRAARSVTRPANARLRFAKKDEEKRIRAADHAKDEAGAPAVPIPQPAEPIPASASI